MVKLLILVPLLLGSTPGSNDRVTIDARIVADRLEVGQEYEIVLDVRFKTSLSASGAGMLQWLDSSAGMEEFIGNWKISISIDDVTVGESSFEVLC